jgi:hypothetical protein
MNRYDNDPFSFKKVASDVRLEKEIEKINEEAESNAFKYTLWDRLCPCVMKISNNEIFEKKRMFFECASSKLDFYTDAITFLKKMIEIDIIKHYLFTLSERKLINIISNPDYTSNGEKLILTRIKNEYKHKKYNPERLDEILKDVLDGSRNKDATNKLLQIIQQGNHKIINSDDT